MKRQPDELKRFGPGDEEETKNEGETGQAIAAE